MKLFHCTLTQTARCLTGSRARWWLRAITSFIVTLCLLLPAFPLPGQTFSGAGRPAVPAPSLSRPLDTAAYAASLFLLYPEMALAQGGVISKTAPAFARPGDTVSYPLVIEKTTPTDWLTGTIVVTDTVPFNTGGPSGAPEPAWSYTFSDGVGRFVNNSIIAGTGVVSVAVFNVVVDPLLANGTIITNTAHFSDSLGTAVSPVVTTTIQAPEFSLLKSASSLPVCAGSLLTYTLVVSNANLDGSPAGVINVPYTQVDRLPAGVSLVSASNSPVTSADTITWTMSSPLDSLWGAGFNAVTRTAVVSVPYSLDNGFTLTNQVTVSHAAVPSAAFVLPITVSKVTPNFMSNSPVAFGAPAVFTNTTLGDATFVWDFGDGVTSTLTHPSHIYAGGGIFTPTLTAASIYGCGIFTVSYPITVVTPATLTVTANPTNTYANGISHTLVTAVVSDTLGAPIAGQPLTFTTSLGHWAGDGQSMVLTTDSLGVVTRTLTSTLAGTAYITVTAPNGISDTTQVVFGRVLNVDTGRWFVTIQNAIDAADTLDGHTILATAGNYTENITITKQITLMGEGQGNTVIYPAFSDIGPVSGGSFQGSQLIVVSADNVTIHNLTVDGDNPALPAVIDARNGIIVNHPAGIFNNLEVYNTTVQNIYLRGLYASSGGSFNFHHNTVQNVQGNAQSIAIMNWAGTGLIAYNQVITAADGIVANHSAGTQFLYNTVSNTPSGIHTDNAGDSGGSADLLQGNSVTNCQPNGYGVWAFVPRLPPIIRQNQVDNCAVGLAVSGSGGASPALTLFESNIVTGTGTSTGVYVTTDGFGWGNGSVTASFISNTITGHDTGFYLEQHDGFVVDSTLQGNFISANAGNGIEITGTTTISLTALYNTITANSGNGLQLSAATAITSAVHGNLICNNGPYGADNQTTAMLNAIGNWWGHNPPLISGTDFSGLITVDPPISLTLTANPAVTLADGASTSLITAAMSGGGYAWPGPITVTVTTDEGTLLPAQVVLTNGVANSTLTLTSTAYPVTATLTATTSGLPCNEVATTTVRFDRPALELLKLGDPDPVQAGGILTYTLIYTNPSGLTANSIWITDTLPAGVTLQTSSPPTTTQSGSMIGWNVGSLAPYAGNRITMTVLLDSPIISGTIITNSAIITAPAALTETTGLVTTTIWSSHTLTVVKTDAPDPVDAGAALEYTLVYTVAGNEPALNTVITDALPANTVFNSASGGITPVGGILTWSLGQLSPPDSGVLTYSVTVASPLPNNTVLTNSVTFFDDSGQVAADTITTTVVSSHTLNLIKTDSPDPVDAGGSLTYTLAYSITGNEAAQNVVVTDTVPANTTYNLCSGGITCGQAGGVVTWNLGNLNTGDSGVLTLTVAVDIPLPNGTVLTNTGHMADTNSGVPASSTVTTTVASITDITFTKSANPPAGSQVAPGDTLIYTLVAANTGSQLATGVLLTDTLPAEVNVVNATGSRAPAPVVAGNLFTWNIGTLTVNETVTATLEVTVTTPLTSGTVIANVGELFTAQTGISTTNTVTHPVLSTPILTLHKSGQPPPGSGVSPGETITYTLAVTNSGNGPATNFQLTDTVPAGTNLVGVSATPGFSALAGSSAITVGGTLNAGQSMAATFVVTVALGISNGTVLANTGYVSYAESPVISATNIVTHVVQSTPVISISKLAQPPGPTIGAGETITYSVVVSNNGGFAAANVVLTDAIPANTHYVAGSANSTLGTVSEAGPLRVDLPSLAAGQSITFTFQVTVTTPITNGTIINNAAYMSANFLPPVESNTVSHTVVATPSLTVSKAASPPGGSEVDPGDAIIYFIRVRNDGSANVTNLTITETIPISTEYVLSQRIPPVGVETIGDPLVWTIPSLAGNGGQVEYRVVVTVTDSAPPGLFIPNVAQISSEQTPLTTTNVVTHQLRQTPSLTISKTADPPSGSGLLPGDSITYTVRLSNTGSTTLTNVMLIDLLDANTTLLDSTANPPALLLGSSALWPALAPNAGVVLELQTVVTLSVPGGTIITNVATGSSAQTAVVASPPVTHVVESIPNLILAKTADPLSGSTLNPGDPITYTLWVTNSGTAAATGVVITDMLDTNLNLVSVTPAASSTNPLVLDAGTLAAGGGSANFTVLVTVTTPLTNGYVLNNQAQVTSVEVPTATLSNLVTHTVVATPNLVINKYATPLPGSIVDPGDGINYFVEIINTGNAPVSNLTITDVLPISTTFFSAQLIPPLGAIISFDPLVAQIPSLTGNGGAVQLRFSVNVADTAPAGLLIPNAAQVVSDQTVLTSTNTVTHQVREAAALNIVKIATPPAGSNVQPGETITYTLIVNNTGAGDANEMTLTDVLPAGVSYVAGSVTSSPGFGVVSTAPEVVITGILAAGSSMTATLQVRVSAAVSGTILTNTAQATATNASLVTTAITHAVVVPAYNVLISKNATPPSGSVVEPGDLITYTVIVTNTGNPVNNVVISDTLDTFVTLGGSSSTHGVVTGPTPLLVSGFDLSTGEIAVLTLTVQVNGVVSGTVINNQASVTATELAALQPSGLITHVISNTIPVPSLAITKAAIPPSGSSVGPNSPITYTVVVENNGSGPANSILITDTLPAEVNLVSANLSGPGAVGSGNPLTASIVTLAAGDRITLTVGVTTSTVATDTVITNVAQTSASAVAMQVSPPVTHLITAVPPVLWPNLVINKSAIPGSGSVVEPGHTITYTIAVQNTGAGAATAVVISDTLDANVGLLSSSTTAGVIGAGNPVQVTGFDLNPGTGVTVTLVVTVTGTTSGTVIGNRVDVSSSQVVTPQLSGSVTHLISNSVTVPPSFTVVKSANPAAGTPVHLNDIIQYTIVIQNSGGPAGNVALTDAVPANTTLVNGSAATNLGSVTESLTQVVANVAGFPAGGTMTTTFQVRVATSSTVNITNLAILDSDQTTPQNSNSVVHPVQASPGGGNNVYLPIILKNFSSSYLSLHWDNVEPVRDRVRPADGAAGVCFSFPCDGQNDGVFRLRVSIGSEGPKTVSNVRLVSSQGIEWNTIPGDGLSTLGLFNGGPLNSSLDGSVSGVLFNPGQVELLMFAADGTPARFLPGQYVFTVIVNFSDGSSLLAQTMTF